MNLSEQFITALYLLISFDTDLYRIIFLSLYISIFATVLSSIISLPLGVFIAVSQYKYKNLTISILNAFTGLPPVVVGLTGYLLFSRIGPLGNLGILYTPTAMILTQTILIVPIITAHIRTIAQDKYSTLQPYYNMVGANKFQIVKSLVWEIRFLMFTAIFAGLGRGLSEVGAMLIVGGNISGHTRIMTTAITLETGKGNLAFALALGCVLLSIILLLSFVATSINSYGEKRYNDKS